MQINSHTHANRHTHDGSQGLSVQSWSVALQTRQGMMASNGAFQAWSATITSVLIWAAAVAAFPRNNPGGYLKCPRPSITALYRQMWTHTHTSILPLPHLYSFTPGGIFTDTNLIPLIIAWACSSMCSNSIPCFPPHRCKCNHLGVELVTAAGDLPHLPPPLSL